MPSSLCLDATYTYESAGSALRDKVTAIMPELKIPEIICIKRQTRREVAE